MFAIYFDKTPEVRIRYIMPYMLEEEIEDIYEKPFISESKLNVVLADKILQEKYKFEIPEFYTWDGATIPRVFWRLIGAKTDNKFLIPSLVHDVLCENHDYVNGDRYFCYYSYVEHIPKFPRHHQFEKVSYPQFYVQKANKTKRENIHEQEFLKSL